MLKKLLIVSISLLFISGCASISRKDLAKVIEENPDLVLEVVKNNPEVVLESIIKFQAEQSQARELVKIRNEIQLSAKNPLNPELAENTFFRGNIDAPITIVEYSDFLCIFCSRLDPSLKKLMEKYPDKIRFTFKHLPLHNGSPNSLVLAKYFEAIALQDQKIAWEFHDFLFENFAKVNQQKLQIWLKEQKLDLDQVYKDLNNPEISKKIQAHQKEANSFNIKGTPTTLINGIKIVGALPEPLFEEVIDNLLNK